MDCTHDIRFLIGDKDGILCRQCGERWKNFAEIPKPGEKPKRSSKKKEAAS